MPVDLSTYKELRVKCIGMQLIYKELILKCPDKCTVEKDFFFFFLKSEFFIDFSFSFQFSMLLITGSE